MSRKSLLLSVLLLVVAVIAQPFTAQADFDSRDHQFVKRVGADLRLNGKPFRFAGTNNYYLMYKSQAMIDDVLTAAAQNRFAVVRTWGWLDIGNQDGSNSVAGKADGVYFHYWNGNQPAYNDGSDGLQRLDYVVAKAGQLGLKLVIPLTNNWSDFGGMDQYVRWRGGQYHDQFYSDPVIRGWFKDWIAHLLNRTNSVTGVQYKNDPTIMTWELANEPRCIGSGIYPRSSNCTTQTLIDWAAEMANYIKSVDNQHLVSVGDEGFYCTANTSDWTANCNEGVDTLAFTALAQIDVMSLHLYPDGWGKDAAWGSEWIRSHIAAANTLGKPVMLGEFGLRDKASRNVVYKAWTDAFSQAGGDGALYWILSGRQDDGTWYSDYDGFTVYATDPVFTTLGNFGLLLRSDRRLLFAPVADNEMLITNFETATTFNLVANDITYGNARLQIDTIDLDPQLAGQQTIHSVAGGSFTLQSGGMLRFVPAAGFAGRAQISYTIRDSAGQNSNAALISVTVKPNPSGALTLFSFESDTEGWAAGNWQSDAGTVAQSSAFHSDGSQSLQVTATGGGWFGLDIPTAIDLSTKTRFKYDLKTTTAGTSVMVALKLGASWTWCQTNGSWINPDTTTTIDLELLSLGCSSPDLSQLHGIFIWFSGGGTHYIDNVRAE